MHSVPKAVIFGIIIWLIAFVFSFLILPLREDNRPLFESLMPVALAFGLTAFSYFYFKKVDENYLKEGILVGLTWFIVNIAIDLPMFLLDGPMKMTLATYISDIGTTYLMMPIFTIGVAMLLEQRAKNDFK